jgi:hypothetical protein
MYLKTTLKQPTACGAGYRGQARARRSQSRVASDQKVKERADQQRHARSEKDLDDTEEAATEANVSKQSAVSPRSSKSAASRNHRAISLGDLANRLAENKEGSRGSRGLAKAQQTRKSSSGH